MDGLKKFHYLFGRGRVEVTGWLVGQNDCRTGDKRPGHGHSLPLTARQFVG